VAGDLIPPPSPAGRPSPDPRPHDDAFAAEQPEPAAAAAGGRAIGPSPFRMRFGFAGGLLLGGAIAAAAVALSVGGLAASNEDEGLAPNWSKWQPATHEAFSGAGEIAEHIQDTYKNEKKRQLASVNGGPIAAGTIPLSVVMPKGDGVDVFPGLGVQYTLTGVGKDGALKDSKPSKERHRLLRREALELALYSFRYLPDVDMVLTILPPAPKAEQILPAKERKAAEPFQPQALFYRPGDLKDRLAVPLRATMADKPPALEQLGGEEAKRVDSLTLSNLFVYERRQSQDGRGFVVLERPKR
jgi:hypothetical protein